jgi:hypothetical protein
VVIDLRPSMKVTIPWGKPRGIQCMPFGFMPVVIDLRPMTARIGNCLIWHCFNQGLLWTGAGKAISQKDSFNLAVLAECLGVLRRLIVNVPSSVASFMASESFTVLPLQSNTFRFSFDARITQNRLGLQLAILSRQTPSIIRLLLILSDQSLLQR